MTEGEFLRLDQGEVGEEAQQSSAQLVAQW